MGESVSNTPFPSLLELAKTYVAQEALVTLNGKNLSLKQIISLYNSASKVQISDDPSLKQKMNQSYEAMMKDIGDGRPVYGSNSAFGGQAARILNQGSIEDKLASARQISDGLVFLDITVGPELPPRIVRAAMAIRINMLLQGVSGVKMDTLETIVSMINHNLIPVVSQFGGIGASGDLAHNQRVVNAARGLKGIYIRTPGYHEKIEAQSALREHHINPLILDPKEGLGLVNGDNFSTALAVDIYVRLLNYYLLSVVVGALVIESLQGTNRTFHPVLSAIRPHKGQEEVSYLYRMLLQDSKLAFQELTGHVERKNGTKVQDGYSLRCIPQFEGVMVEIIRNAINTITINMNSVSDNPVWVPEDLVTEGEHPWQWVSGGNFLAMHMAEALDQARKITTQLIKRNDRHLARLIDIHENNGLPANLSNPNSITQCTFKGVQIQSGMFDVYSMLLANPVTTLFGTHEERNQDITTHALTSGILAGQNLELLKYSLAMNMMAVTQAIDLRGGESLLSPRTRHMYKWIRSYINYVYHDRPLANDIELLAQAIESGAYHETLFGSVFSGL